MEPHCTSVGDLLSLALVNDQAPLEKLQETWRLFPLRYHHLQTQQDKRSIRFYLLKQGALVAVMVTCDSSWLLIPMDRKAAVSCPVTLERRPLHRNKVAFSFCPGPPLHSSGFFILSTAKKYAEHIKVHEDKPKWPPTELVLVSPLSFMTRPVVLMLYVQRMTYESPSCSCPVLATGISLSSNSWTCHVSTEMVCSSTRPLSSSVMTPYPLWTSTPANTLWTRPSPSRD